MAENMFELVGRISWKDCKATDNGSFIVKVCLGQKTYKKDNEGKNIWNNYFITFIDAPKVNNGIASTFADNVKVDDYVRIKGVLNIDSFIPKNSTDGKKISNISLIGKTFKKVVWDDFEKSFIDA